MKFKRLFFPSRAFWVLFLWMYVFTLAAEEEPVPLRLRTLLVERAEPEHLYWRGEEAFIRNRVSHVQPSPWVEIPRRDPLPVYDSPPDPHTGQAPPPAATIALPPDTDHILVLVFDASESGERRYVAVPDEDPARGDPAVWRLMNTTSSPILLQIGEGNDPVLIQPVSLRYLNVGNVGTAGAAVTAAARIEGEAQLFHSTYWPVYDDRKVLVLFTMGNNTILLRRITERIRPAVRP
ncbi:MAG: hypothetical protein JJU05_02265 [Verrucomicrobia bacterium]|nr:hypothetical protein [Verrucomicrobiota bacterium]MCH8528092.1 hypothetical protein [Kiritimatiellia bacterium]